ncbi:hypothetical protein MUO14_10300 [Halobacillus shinanisalinarum]|uniref:Polymerase nucleotidyl transferase domain-containing protein n=1 Tax=Halobacillus shinanisalinarum TaxID=2932258 RepID=A0ABY4H486_9BACI|nr:hypothetical protein [Halobacillus shinanisalinarum]UOQ95276.1 hypothetical protein MUO14_10300 [Halobacillus shinanisalinarum]
MDLIEIAKCFVEESQGMGADYAFVTGSVARGDDDQYSDLDLSIYSSGIDAETSINEFYRNKMLQVSILPVSKLLSLKELFEDPWSHRYIDELYIIKDNENRLYHLQNQAKAFLHSLEGRKQQIKIVTHLINERQSYANKMLEAGYPTTATQASLGAWAEAALLYSYLEQGTLSTGAVIPFIQEKHIEHFQSFLTHSPFTSLPNTGGIINNIGHFRHYLRNRKKTLSFDLSPHQDSIFVNKAKRYQSQGANLAWIAYGEALWLFFEEADNKLIEEFLDSCPLDVQNSLLDLGFQQSSKANIQQLHVLTDELIHYSHCAID